MWKGEKKVHSYTNFSQFHIFLIYKNVSIPFVSTELFSKVIDFSISLKSVLSNSFGYRYNHFLISSAETLY